MNKRELSLKVNGVWKSYHVPSMPIYAKRKKNCLFIHKANSYLHEKAKFDVCWEILKANKTFITEAVDNKTNLRRDVVILDNGVIIEVETDEKRAQRFKGIANLVVIPLWKSDDVKKALLDALI